MSDSKVIQLAVDGAVVNVILVPADAAISDGGDTASWADGELQAPAGGRFYQQDGAGIGWILSGSSLAAPPEPDQPPAPTAPVLTSKADVIRRSTDDEADALDAALVSASSKLRLLWNSVTVIDHGADEFPILHDAVLSALTGIMAADQAAARTTTLLMPSE